VDTYGRGVGRPKNGKARTISLPRWLRDRLAEQFTQPAPGRRPGAHGVSHGQRQGGYHLVFMRGVFGPADAALPAEKQGLRFHDLRHTSATLLIPAGAHAKRVEERLGHSSITTTLNLDGHVLPCPEAALVDALDAIYEQCDEGDDAPAAQGS
jgi:integrase